MKLKDQNGRLIAVEYQGTIYGQAGQSTPYSYEGDLISGNVDELNSDAQIDELNSFMLQETPIKIVRLPNCSIIGQEAFFGCSSLEIAYFKNCKNIYPYAFDGCLSLSDVYIDNCEYLDYGVFRGCSSLSKISLKHCSYISNETFKGCVLLTDLYLGASVPSFGNTAFSSTPIDGYSQHTSSAPHIWVPSSAYSNYISHSKWSRYSSIISTY